MGNLNKLVAMTAGMALVMFEASSALARDWPTTAGWDILEGEDYCAMHSEFEGKGDTELSLAKEIDGTAMVVLTNDDWSATKDQHYELTFFLDSTAFSGGTAIGVGDTYEKKGFVTKFGADFFPALARASGFRAYLGGTLVDDLSLKGSAAALAVVDRCVASIKAVHDAEERERQRFAHIPDDPFAAAKPAPTAGAARPIGDAANWVSSDDYPPAALRMGASGKVGVSLKVGPSGRVTNCAVTTSSGNADLDTTTCQLMMRRARYAPATDGKGTPVESTDDRVVVWSLPS